MVLNIERRERYAGQGRTYVKSQAKIPINYDLSSLDLMCSFVVSENRNVKKGQYINLRNLMEMLDMDRYINDHEKSKRITFIKKGLEARLLQGLSNPEMIVKYVNGGLMDDDIIDINTFTNLSNNEIDWINQTVSQALSFSFIWMEADRMIQLFTKFKTADYKSVSGIVSEIEEAVAYLNMKFRKAKVEKSTETTFSLKEDIFGAVLSDIYGEVNSMYRKLITGMQGVNQVIGGGFENTRVYLFIGGTGGGKSMTMLNIAYQIKKYNKNFKPKDPTKIPCIVILTMENTVTETVTRLFQMCNNQGITLNDVSYDEAVSILRNSGELYLNDNSPIDIIIKFKPNRSVDTGYLYTLTEDLEDEGYEVICMIQDHVKRIRSTTYQQDIRLELGDVINEFKTFAMIKDIPVITVSHLNRDGARTLESATTTSKTDLTRQLGKSNIGESLLMLDNVDFAAILNKEYDSDGNGYMVFKGIKYRMKVLRDYICQPFVPGSEVKLVEDFYSKVPLFKETLAKTTLNQNGNLSKVKQNGFMNNIVDLDKVNEQETDEDEIFEFVRNNDKSRIFTNDNKHKILSFVS